MKYIHRILNNSLLYIQSYVIVFEMIQAYFLYIQTQINNMKQYLVDVSLPVISEIYFEIAFFINLCNDISVVFGMCLFLQSELKKVKRPFQFFINRN